MFFSTELKLKFFFFYYYWGTGEAATSEYEDKYVAGDCEGASGKGKIENLALALI